MNGSHNVCKTNIAEQMEPTEIIFCNLSIEPHDLQIYKERKIPNLNVILVRKPFFIITRPSSVLSTTVMKQL